MNRIKVVAYALPLVFCGATGSNAQSREQLGWIVATDAQQQALELAGARAVAPILAKGLGATFKTIALDERVYSESHDPVFIHDAAAMQYPVFSSALVASHSEKHLGDIADIFGLHARVTDQTTCVVQYPSQCRIGKNDALLAFAPAVLRGDSAFVMIKLIMPNRSTASSVSMSIWTVTLIPNAKGWSVVRIGQNSVN